MIGTFRVGEDIAIALDATRGNVADVVTITAQIALAYRDGGPLKAAPVSMTVTDRAATSDTPAGWTLSLLAAVTDTMAPGFYAIDALLDFGGGIEITAATAYISLTRSVFG